MNMSEPGAGAVAGPELPWAEGPVPETSTAADPEAESYDGLSYEEHVEIAARLPDDAAAAYLDAVEEPEAGG